MNSDSISYLTRYVSKKKAEKAAFVIPHPNYIGAYSPSAVQIGADTDKFRLLFLGQLREYKNIELLIEAVTACGDLNVDLTIAGNIKSEEYKSGLISMVQERPGITLHPEFIGDEHRVRLEQQIRKAYADWENDRCRFEQNGEKVYKQVKQNNSVSVIEGCCERLFEELSAREEHTRRALLWLYDLRRKLKR